MAFGVKKSALAECAIFSCGAARWPHRLDANQSEPSLNCRCLPVVVNHWLCATPPTPPAALRATACVPTCPSRMGVRDQQASASL